MVACSSQEQPGALSRQDRCLLLRQDRCLRLSAAAAVVRPVSTADICSVSTEDIYPVSTEDITAAGRRPAAAPSQIRARAQNHQNGPKWVENGRQVLRIDPQASHDHSQGFGTSPAAKNLGGPRTAWGRGPDRGKPRAMTGLDMPKLGLECRAGTWHAWAEASDI